MMLTVGADPEVLLYDPVSQQHVPVVGLLGGTKHKPKETKHGAVQEDNVMAEFCINPATNEIELVNNIRLVLDDMRELLPGLEFSRSCSAIYDPNHLTSKQAQEAGCDPDFNCWRFGSEEFINSKPPVTDGCLRTAGGHVHVGFRLPEDKRTANAERIDLIKCLDVTLGCPSILMDKDKERRKLYGKAGAHRPKKYGIEYRVLSNFWIWDDEVIKWVWRGVEKALDLKETAMKGVNDWEDKIVRSINTSDMVEAKRVARYFGAEVLG